jgi:hypothetical protein
VTDFPRRKNRRIPVTIAVTKPPVVANKIQRTEVKEPVASLMIMSSGKESGQFVLESGGRARHLSQGAESGALLHREGLAKRVLLHRSAPPCADRWQRCVAVAAATATPHADGGAGRR